MLERPFYDKAIPMENLAEFSEPGRFVKVPDDWWAISTDVVGSTNAIAEGRYKDVNLVGAAVIPVIIQGLDLDCPYIFNGDGALMLIPGAQRKKAETILKGLVHLANANFRLELRAALFSVGELRVEGLELEMGRLRLVGEQTLAQFRGSMVAAFDERLRVKGQALVTGDAKIANIIDLNSLSCRWQAQPARNGEILSILLLAKGASSDPIEGFLSLLSTMTGGELSKLNPVSTSLRSYQTVLEAIRTEARFHAKLLSMTFARRLLSICISVPLFRWGLARRYDWAELYLKNLHMHSDFHKLDEALRLVIDCTPEQSKRVIEYLQSGYDAGKLYYGLHKSTASQMTCYVESLNDAAHVHFIDGCDGGYVAAASALKRQLAQ